MKEYLFKNIGSPFTIPADCHFRPSPGGIYKAANSPMW